jgi:hypothetical protein
VSEVNHNLSLFVGELSSYFTIKMHLDKLFPVGYVIGHKIRTPKHKTLRFEKIEGLDYEP